MTVISLFFLNSLFCFLSEKTTRFLDNQSDPVPLVLDLRIAHERFGRSSDLSINGNLHYPNVKDRSLHETDTEKILKYLTDYNNNPPISVVRVKNTTHVHDIK